MKISARNRSILLGRPAARRSERGFLVIALLAIVSIMLIYVTANMRLLSNLRRELKLVEQAQIQRLQRCGAEPLPLPNTRTNATATNSSGLPAQ